METLFSPIDMALRSAATTLPYVAGWTAAALTVGYVFQSSQQTQEITRNRRAFLRKLCDAGEIADAILLHYHRVADPIAEAMRALMDPSTAGEIRQALRAALAVSL